MKKFSRLVLFAGFSVLALAGCSEVVEKPAPVSMTDTALGHYCQMYVLEHAGPKAQIHLKGIEEPLWFAQVTDAVAYLHDPEREADVVATYVSDMSKASSWGEPGRDNWMEAEKAVYVISSKQLGGMGTPEAIPFSSKADAEAFVAREDGSIIPLAEIADSYIRPAGSVDSEAVGSVVHHGG